MLHDMLLFKFIIIYKLNLQNYYDIQNPSGFECRVVCVVLSVEGGKTENGVPQ